MTKKLVITPDGVQEVDLTAEEETQRTADIETANTKLQEEQDAKTANENLKASAKAKLMSGEALTEDEANTIVL